ncbi:MAG: DPP IV N-terminal domain-containing protein, partial [Chthoniobacteraceae bacterium]
MSRLWYTKAGRERKAEFTSQGRAVHDSPMRFLPILFLFLTTLASGQGTRADYERADQLRERSRGKVLNLKVEANWSKDGKQLWYRRQLANGGEEFVTVDAATGARTSAAQAPWPAEKTDAAPRRERRGGDRTRDASPDGKWKAFVREANAWVRASEGGAEFQLTREGSANDGYKEEFAWSPDSRRLVAMREVKGDERKVYLIESSPKDQLQPKLSSYDYLKPGDRIPQVKPHLFDMEKRAEIAVADALFPNPWSIEHVRWEPDSRRFTFVYNQRAHQVLRIVAVEAETGATRAIVDEQSATFVCYSGKQFAHYADGAHEVVWMSERDGWNRLWLFDAANGQVKNQITRGEWVVRGVDRVDEEKRQIWFRAGGIRAGQNPYFIHYCRVNFDGTGFVILTEGDGSHRIDWSPDGRFFIDTWSRVDLANVSELRDADGNLICELERAQTEAGWLPPERFTAKGRDGSTAIYGVIFRPTNFDRGKKYPVIEQIYAGPHDSFVPVAFREWHGPQQIAEIGFIVVQIDGMGTSNRSKKFHDVCWKNLGDSGFSDRILWMKAAAEKHPEMDLTRVGIYGGSAGGQSALRALQAHGDFYKVAVADCGCHDNRMDKIWWNEQWMGWPVGPHYAEQSNVTNAAKTQG